MEKIINFWNGLPKEVKVSCYVIVSAAITEAIKYLSNLGVNDLLLMGLINVAIVALVELKKRIQEKA